MALNVPVEDKLVEVSDAWPVLLQLIIDSVEEFYIHLDEGLGTSSIGVRCSLMPFACDSQCEQKKKEKELRQQEG